MRTKINVEHWCIDFKFLVIGEKIKHLASGEQMTKTFDDQYFAELIMEGQSYDTFYDQESVKNIIDFQFQKTYKVYSSLFWFYLCFYWIPYMWSLVYNT